MPKNYQWTNHSVLEFACGEDPIATMEARARALALNAMDDGWRGPPFDPLVLAQRLGLSIDARGDIPDARLVPTGNNNLVLEYNPTRPRGRLRFSIAHEIAHTLFADCADQVRHRGVDTDAASDNWQLEVLCNIGAAELLMPSGSFTQLAEQRLSIREVMNIRKEYDVSVEACLIRLIKLARIPCAAFCASAHRDGGYKIDYVIPAPGYDCPISAGHRIPGDSVVAEANAIGFTAVGKEDWGGGQLTVECVGLAPYPGNLVPRVVGLLIAQQEPGYQPPALLEVDGDALQPRGTGPRLVAHVIPDTNSVWGGRGFASQLRHRFPVLWTQFRTHATNRGYPPRLGEVFWGKISDEVYVAHMVAQRGIGASSNQRLRYAVLVECLAKVREKAIELGASVHLPRVGTGHGGASWDIVKELITEELVEQGVTTTIYRWPT